jgi:hypothetical protein
MTTHNDALAEARNKLDSVNGRINAHVLNTSPMKEAREVVAQHRDDDKSVIQEELRKQGLPTTGEQGRALLFGLTSLARLNRKRIKIEERVSTLEGNAAA